MSLIDTWAATGAGAFTLSENGLYTVDAWEIFLDRLKKNGIFTVARWYNPRVVHETGRVLSLAVSTLQRRNIVEYHKHIALISSGNVSVLLLSPQPFSDPDIAKMREVVDKYKYQFVITPGQLPKDPVFRQIFSARSEAGLAEIGKGGYFNFDAPTDNKPYFFNMLRLEKIFVPIMHPGVARGNMLATSTLMQLILALSVLCVITIIVPLWLRRSLQKEKTAGVLWSGAFYFILIGAGFMLVEIGLIQTLSVFLGHPSYALGILLFTIIASTGCGGYLSERLPLMEKPFVYVYAPATAVLILLTHKLLQFATDAMVASSMSAKIFASIAFIFPLGICMGFFFPTGMRLVRSIADADTPWYWALNGVFGVLCSALAVFISIYFGIAVNFYAGFVCYFLVLFCILRIDSLKTQAAL